MMLMLYVSRKKKCEISLWKEEEDEETNEREISQSSDGHKR